MTAVLVVIVIALAWYPVLRLVWWLTWRCGIPLTGEPRKYPDDPERAEMERNTPVDAFGLGETL